MQWYSLGKEACIDESLVPFRARIVFRQYIPSKRYKYSIKIFKLCAKEDINKEQKYMLVKIQQDREQ